MWELKAKALPVEDKATPKQICDYLMERGDLDKDGKIGKKEFVQAAMASRTIQQMLVGTLAASSSPFLGRKRAGSKGSGTRSRSGSTSSTGSAGPSVPRTQYI